MKVLEWTLTIMIQYPKVLRYVQTICDFRSIIQCLFCSDFKRFQIEGRDSLKHDITKFVDQILYFWVLDHSGRIRDTSIDCSMLVQ